jgi:hypothetical protein
VEWKVAKCMLVNVYRMKMFCVFFYVQDSFHSILSHVGIPFTLPFKI